MADYLRGDTNQNKTDRALDHLTRNEESPLNQPDREQQKSKPIMEDKLAGLSKIETDPDQQPLEVTPNKGEDLDKANDKLSGLLGD